MKIKEYFALYEKLKTNLKIPHIRKNGRRMKNTLEKQCANSIRNAI